MTKIDDKLRILLISPLPPPAGGIATWTKLFINSSQSKRHVVDVVNTSIIGERGNVFWKKNLLNELKRNILIFYEAKSKIKKKYHIAHINSSCSTFGMIRDYLCVRTARKSKLKVVVHFHCDTNYMVKGKFPEFIFSKICNDANQIFCLNQTSEHHIKSISNKIAIKVPNFIDTNHIDSTTHEISPKIKDIIFVGHVIKSKGCMEIISVANKLPHINFKLIGKVSEEFRAIKKPENIQYYGEVSKEEVINQMLLSDLFLFPTYTEGFPNAILEAMAIGLPIISTPVGAIPEIIEDKGGKIVEVGNIEGLLKAIEELQEPVVREGISTWNREKVKKYYKLDLVIEKMYKEYSII